MVEKVKTRSKPKTEQDVHQHHEELVAGFKEQMKGVLNHSSQPVFMYLDDKHKTGNKKAAQLLGYASVKEFEDSGVNFVETYVAEADRDKVVKNYHGPFKQEFMASVLTITMQNLAGKKLPVRLIHVPMLFRDHLFAVSFVEHV